jgi:HD domain
MSHPRSNDPIGSIGWTERTGGVLTPRECLSLARPLLRGELRIIAGRLVMALRMHSGRRTAIDPTSLVPPDSSLARDAEVAAQDLLTRALLNHSRRAYAWGAAIAALDGITFDRELLYLAAMFHDTGLPSPVPRVDFTVRSAALARDFTDSRHVPAHDRELVANAIAMHHTPGVGVESGAEAYLLSAAQRSTCSGCGVTRYPMQSARASSRNTRGWASSGSSPGYSEPRPSKSLVVARGTCTASP